MKRTIELNNVIVTFEETDELKQKVYDKVLEFFLKTESFSGESIMQSDEPIIESPVLLSDIADDVFQFDVEWK